MKGYDILKQIIPFKKELLFKTKINEITSISLEHSISSVVSDKVVGNFLITGDYKMTEGSINREKFKFDVPFEINLDSRYNTDSIEIDIDNFYYEVINNEALRVNIDVYLIGERLLEDISTIKDKDVKKSDLDSSISDDILEVENIKYDKVKRVESIIDDSVLNDEGEKLENNVLDNNNVFGSMDSLDTYVTYYVYVVKEDDTLDKILDKFNISKEELEKYNDINNIKEKMKLIIPSSNE